MIIEYEEMDDLSLDAELDDGRMAALAMIDHLMRMGASEVNIPIVYDGVAYEVIARPKADGPIPQA